MGKISCVSREQAKKFIDDEFARPQSNKVLHTHPSPMYWRVDNGEARKRLEQRFEFAKTHVLATNLYLGIPYCLPTDPSHCGFCLFPTKDYQGNGQMLNYLDYLEKEASLIAPYVRNDKLASIYVGGGTPNLLRNEEYSRLMNIARMMFAKIPDDIEKTLEGIPQLFNREKVFAIRDAGFNRVSMGVQQMSDRLIRFSGRKQTRKQVLDALDNFNEANLAVNVDLIYGWPGQTTNDMLNDLAELVDQGVRHITHYQLNVAGKSNFSKTQRALLPTVDETIEMYSESKRYLQSNGFRQVTVYDWERVSPTAGRFESENSHRYQYEELQRDFLKIENREIKESRNVIGVGYAAISGVLTEAKERAINYTQINSRSLDEYFDRLDANELPVERQFLWDCEDLRLVWLFQSMQAMVIDSCAYSTIFGSNVFEDFSPIFDELNSRGWISVESKLIKLIDLGQFHIPLIQALFSYARLEEMRADLKTIGPGKKTIHIVEA